MSPRLRKAKAEAAVFPTKEERSRHPRKGHACMSRSADNTALSFRNPSKQKEDHRYETDITGRSKGSGRIGALQDSAGAREIFADIRTPVEVLRALKNVSRHCFLLESAEDSKQWGRYSFLVLTRPWSLPVQITD